MSSRKTAPPPRGTTARSGKSVRSSLIVKGKAVQKKKRSAQESSTLDDRFHRTLRRSPARRRAPNCNALAT